MQVEVLCHSLVLQVQMFIQVACRRSGNLCSVRDLKLSHDKAVLSKLFSAEPFSTTPTPAGLDEGASSLHRAVR